MKFSLMKTLVVAFIGGLLFSFINTPLPWMLGPLTTIAVWKTVFRRVVYWPVAIRNAGLIILGCMIGSSFTRDAAVQILHQLPSMFLVTVATILFSILMGWLTYKGTGVSLPTAIIGCVPGGLSQMTLLGEEIEGADTTVITFLQTARLLSAVFIVPFIVIHGTDGGGQQLVQQGLVSENAVLSHSLWVPLLFAVVILFAVWLAVRLHFPIPFLLGPILGAGVLVLSGAPNPNIPHFLSVVSQLFVGTYLGASLQLTDISSYQLFRVLLILFILPSLLKRWFNGRINSGQA